jgi:hypothetical protein
MEILPDRNLLKRMKLVLNQFAASLKMLMKQIVAGLFSTVVLNTVLKANNSANVS